jgi:hypothetical protein
VATRGFIFSLLLDLHGSAVCDGLLTKDEWRKGFAVYENTISGLYEACKREVLGQTHCGFALLEVLVRIASELTKA